MMEISSFVLSELKIVNDSEQNLSVQPQTADQDNSQACFRFASVALRKWLWLFLGNRRFYSRQIFVTNPLSL